MFEKKEAPATEKTDETPQDAKGLPEWKTEVARAEERQKNWLKYADETVEIYEAEKEAENTFNILFSNTETVLPTLYSDLPRPIAKRRYDDADPLAKAACSIAKNMMQFFLATNDPTNTPFSEAVTSDIMGALVPGRGVSWVQYEAGFAPVAADPEESAKGLSSDNPGSSTLDAAVPDNDSTNDDAVEDDDSDPADDEDDKFTAKQETVTFENIYLDSVPYDRFLHGYGRKWSDVPWVGRIHMMSRAQLYKTFGQIGNTVKLTESGGKDSRTDQQAKTKDAESANFARVYEVWDKSSRKQFFFTSDGKQFLRVQDDPLKLEGFFPCAMPLQFIRRLSTLVPVTPYKMYRSQAKELNKITKRIDKLVEAMKVRGFYDSTLQGLEELMKSADNQLLPAQNVAAMLQGQTLDRAIWLMPIEKLITVLQQLYTQRQQCKTVIYEIMGLSDIQRGVSEASESATASNLKDKWGSLRLSRMQQETENYIASTLRLMLEAGIQLFKQETIMAMTNLQLPTRQQQQQAQQTLQAMQQQYQQQAMQAQQAGQQPPPQPQPDPQLEMILSQPCWEDCLDLLKDDLHRNFRIDIETGSTVSSKVSQDKADIMEFMNAFSQLLNGLQPMVAEGYMPFEAAKAIMLAVTRKYSFGTEVEDQLEQMSMPQPQGGPQGPSQGEQAQDQAKQAQAQADMQNTQQAAALTQAENNMKMQQMQMQNEIAMTKLQVEKQKLINDQQRGDMEHQVAMAELTQRMQMARMPPVPKGIDSVN